MFLPAVRTSHLRSQIAARLAVFCVLACACARADTTIGVSNTVVQSSVKRFGINLGWNNYFDSGQIMKNLAFRNPGFEGQIYQSLVQVATGGTTSFVDNNTTTAWTAGFWNGASYEVIWSAGSAKGRSGTITSSTAPSGGSGVTYQLSASGVAISAGDIVVLRKTTNSGATTGWTSSVSGGGTIADETADLPPGTDGKMCVRLNNTPAGSFAAVASSFETSAFGTFLQLNGHYRVSFKAKGAGGGNTMNCSVARLAPSNTSFVNQNVSLTTSWQTYDVDFTAAETGASTGSVQVQLRPVSQSAILIDDVSLTQTDGDPANTTAYRDAVVNALKGCNPGILRYANTEYGDSLDNQIAPVFGRLRSGYATRATAATDIQFGLHEFLELCEAIGAEPWYSFPSTFSAQEIANLMEYLGGDGTTAYGARRIARGHVGPWTGAFAKIHLEFGNEVWNNADFNGETIASPTSHGNRASELFGIAKSSPYYASAKFDMVLGGQASFVARSQAIHAASANHDTLALAPYFGGHIDHYSSNEDLFGTLFAEPESVDANNGYMQQEASGVQSSSHPVPLAIYEVNLHTTDGTMPQATLNAFTPSIGAGIANAGHMLMMLRNQGIKDQILYSLTQYSNGTSNANAPYVLLWGAERDMGVTDRKRPQYLALQFTNQVMAGNLMQTTLSGDNPTWLTQQINGLIQTTPFNAHYLQSYAFANGPNKSLIVFNFHRTGSLGVNFTGVSPSNGSVTLKRLTSANITDTNESAQTVAVTTQTLNNFNPSQSLSLPPFSMNALQWSTAGTLQFSAPNYSVNENGGAATITVTRTAGSDGAVSVSYATSNGTATGSDYTATSGTLNWADGDETSKIFSISITNDTLAEGDETVNLALSAPTGSASLGAQAAAVLTIADNPIDAWRFANFGADANNALIAGDTANRSGDGIVNLLKYALGLNPNVSSVSGLPTASSQSDSGSKYLVITFQRPTSATDVSYTVQASGNLTSWVDGSSYAASGNTPTNANTTEISRATSAGTETIVVRDNTPLSPTSPRFLRLKVSR